MAVVLVLILWPVFSLSLRAWCHITRGRFLIIKYIIYSLVLCRMWGDTLPTQLILIDENTSHRSSKFSHENLCLFASSSSSLWKPTNILRTSPFILIAFAKPPLPGRDANMGPTQQQATALAMYRSYLLSLNLKRNAFLFGKHLSSNLQGVQWLTWRMRSRLQWFSQLDGIHQQKDAK